MNIAEVNAVDTRGGAAIISWNLFRAFRDRGHHSKMVVGCKFSNDSDVVELFHDKQRNIWARLWLSFAGTSDLSPSRNNRGRTLRSLSQWIGQPLRITNVLKGREDFEFPATYKLMDLFPQRLDIIHCHNLHPAYFDLRALPWLSSQVPVVLTLHDAWLLSGHCAHSFACEKWKTGCGACPDLSISPALKHDGTAYNWKRKKAIFSKSRIYVSTPSQWLMNKVNQSILKPAMIEGKVIPNGIDLSIFKSTDKVAVRDRLGISRKAITILFSADRFFRNQWKDFETIKNSLALISAKTNDKELLFIGLGENAPSEYIGNIELRFVPYESDPQKVAQYYQAGDIYLQASHEDTFPNSVLEALACGMPVIATAVGGIPEQVKGLQYAYSKAATVELNQYTKNNATGILVPRKDAQSMAEALDVLLKNESLLLQVGGNAARDAGSRFDVCRQAEDYIEWFSEILRLYSAN